MKTTRLHLLIASQVIGQMISLAVLASNDEKCINRYSPTGLSDKANLQLQLVAIQRKPTDTIVDKQFVIRTSLDFRRNTDNPLLAILEGKPNSSPQEIAFLRKTSELNPNHYVVKIADSERSAFLPGNWPPDKLAVFHQTGNVNIPVSLLNEAQHKLDIETWNNRIKIEIRNTLDHDNPGEGDFITVEQLKAAVLAQKELTPQPQLQINYRNLDVLTFNVHWICSLSN